MMNKVIDLIKMRNEQNQVFSNSDILKIFRFLIKYYNIHTVSDISFDSSYKYFMNYCVENGEIKINLSKIVIASDASIFNYSVLFAMLHELEHASQIEYINNNDDSLSLVYSKCFDMIKNKDLANNVYYSLFHNYFPTEYNADIKAYINLIKIINSIGDKKAENEYTEYLYKRMEDSKLKDFQELLEIIYGSDLESIIRSVSNNDAKLVGLIKHI